MANQGITFSIGSVFNGEGFNAARKSVGEMSKSVKQAASASQQLAGAVGGMNNAASKAAGAMSIREKSCRAGKPGRSPRPWMSSPCLSACPDPSVTRLRSNRKGR